VRQKVPCAEKFVSWQVYWRLEGLVGVGVWRGVLSEVGSFERGGLVKYETLEMIAARSFSVDAFEMLS